MRKVIVAGGRDFKNAYLMNNVLDALLHQPSNSFNDNLMIIEGGAKGADELAYHYADTRYIPHKRVLADWSLGRRAGPIRNQKMAEMADELIAFWDGKSRGTKNMILTMQKLKKKVSIIRYD